MEKKKKLIIVALIVIAINSLIGLTVFATKNYIDKKYGSIFFDDFSGDTIDTSKWLIAQKSWGGNNGGVVPENVSVSNGTLKLEGHGNYYTGDVPGINRPDGIRTGAAIATREYFSSGTYEVVAKVAPEFGACSAIWTFEYEEYYPGEPEYEAAGATGSYYEINHEIDIEMPGRPSNDAEPSFNYALCNTFLRENIQTTNFTELSNAQNDGNWHTYRFDWHTGDKNEIPRVDYYVDGVLVKTCTTNIPTNAGRFWIGIWFPCSEDADKDGVCETGWTGTANFDTTIFEIDSVKITPLREAGDTEQNETYGKEGWAPDSFPEDIEKENYNHILNGDFSKENEGWTLDGDAKVKDEMGVLTSGSKTDVFSQIVKVEPKMTYTLTADVITNGTAVTIGAKKLNGTNDTSKTVTESGKVKVTFTTDDLVKEIKIYLEVLRYQDGNEEVKVDNVTLYPGKGDENDKPDEKHDEKPEENQDKNINNLIVNGDFSKKGEEWNISGGTIFSDGKVVLQSGSDTDTISQKVKVKKSTTYILTADVVTDGTEVTIGVKDYNGRYTQKSETVNNSGKLTIEFTTASHIDLISVFAEVLRYQDKDNKVYIDNICLVEKEHNNTQTEDKENGNSNQENNSGNNNDNDNNNSNGNNDNSENLEQKEINLIINGEFNDSSNWNLIGSPKIENGKAILSSGLDTDIIEQKITVKPNTKYRLTADIISSGAEVDLAVSGYDGKYSETKSSYTNKAKGILEYTTGYLVDDFKVFIHVLRYQENSEDVIIDNIVLQEIN